jgi:acid phosphatase family membrane protein YuiD
VAQAKRQLLNVITELIHNQTLVIAACAWAIAQLLKVIVVLVQEKRVAWNYLVTSGGMPSSHTATVCALATAVALNYGTGSVYFSIAVVLAVIVMYDAAGVRQSVGQHSAFLNRIVKEFSYITDSTEREKVFREFIGHTPFQVIVGAVLGILIAWGWVSLL